MPPLIPQAIGWVLCAVGAALVGRLVARQWQRVNDDLHPHDPLAETHGQGRIPALRRDPQSGVYRPE